MNSRQVKKEFFDRLPGFLAAIEQISATGFFGMFNADIRGHEGTIRNVVIMGQAFIPDNPKDRCVLIGPLIDVDGVMTKIRDMVNKGDLRVIFANCKVVTGDWKKYDSEGKNVIGSNGSEINFDLNLVFDNVIKKKKAQKGK